jgi:hypothetical protein
MTISMIMAIVLHRGDCGRRYAEGLRRAGLTRLSAGACRVKKSSVLLRRDTRRTCPVSAPIAFCDFQNADTLSRQSVNDFDALLVIIRVIGMTIRSIAGSGVPS